jgi:hypothetical protein
MEGSLGYQVVEPSVLRGLFTRPTNFVVATVVMKWLVDELSIELGSRLDGIQIDVIRVEYVSVYPALGIKYANPSTQDVAGLVESAIERIIETRSVSSVIRFVSANDIDWDAVTNDIVGSADRG